MYYLISLADAMRPNHTQGEGENLEVCPVYKYILTLLVLQLC